MSVSTRTIALTDSIQVNEGSHILYFYQSEELYVQNLVSFILSAIELKQHAIVIETPERFKEVKKKLIQILNENEIEQFLYFVDNYEFYQKYQDFHFDRVLDNFKNTVQPFVNENLVARVWGLVEWKDQPNILEKLYTYECECDLTVSEIGYITVCCYDGNTVPSYILTEMMRSHPYFMTDKELVKSTLYNHGEQTVFPSLATQREIESELDFYKQKLDFIHVVAHEVRNPLTVIKSFATILKTELSDPDVQARLSLIEDYSVAIDHEIHHIIQTEQMLTSDTFWKKKLIKVEPILEEVFDIMMVKARTQNITIKSDIRVPNNTIIRGNNMGFKLILSNLLSNAIKYSFENSNVYLTCFIKDNALVLDIIDQGVGISPENLEKLFQKYQKLNEEAAGQGIGLFMVYKLVNHFNGDISVESELGRGTSFRLTFPL
ncbi:MEDS domain-containing protein [Alkalihalobacterium elongatum]|uniref:MEDS domain-containing protein n=1 Tax=Alkalihalobacterium elongatum TaxID=2675466 RepID=UPI001C1FFD67|nr:MEDS domain-containing protein [Alkalihalobacterium elongatum]